MSDVTTEKVHIELSDGTIVDSDDFVVVTNDESCNAKLYFCADVLTLGQAIQLISYAYTEQLAELPEDDAERVREALRLFLEIEKTK
jgi:hypothetical protein